jgi:outer membrane protein assembly factor BamB
MKSKFQSDPTIPIFFTSLLISILGCETIAVAQPVNNSGIVLREGVVIEQNRKELYIINPDNKMEAISLTTGQTLWSTGDKIKPLTLVNGKLICQAISPGRQNEFAIVALDLTQNGRIISRNTIQLPDNVNTDYRQTGNSYFSIQTRVINGQAYFSWEYNYIPLRGIFEEESINKDKNEIIKQSGAFKIDNNSGKLNSINKEQLPNNFLSQSIVLDQQNRIPNIKTLQFVSKDEKYAMASNKVAEDIVFNTYQWEIYERASGSKVGQILDYRSYAPFYVSGNTIIYEIGPYVRALKDGIEEVPLKIVAVDLETGKVLWSKEILDTIYRGPLPS